MTATQFESFLALCRAALGSQHVLTDDADKAPYLTDWRKRYTGEAIAVLRPGTTEEVAAAVHACHAHQIAMVPQGGNTGLCGGATPMAGTGSVVISLQRLNRVRQVDPLNNTVTVEAGVILQGRTSSLSRVMRCLARSMSIPHFRGNAHRLSMTLFRAVPNPDCQPASRTRL